MRIRERKPVAYRGKIRPGVLVRPGTHTRAFVNRHLRGGDIVEVVQRMGHEIKGFRPYPLGTGDLREVYARRGAEDIFVKRTVARAKKNTEHEHNVVGCVDRNVAMVAALRELKKRRKIDNVFFARDGNSCIAKFMYKGRCYVVDLSISEVPEVEDPENRRTELRNAELDRYAEGECPYDVGLWGLEHFRSFASNVLKERRTRY